MGEDVTLLPPNDTESPANTDATEAGNGATSATSALPRPDSVEAPELASVATPVAEETARALPQASASRGQRGGQAQHGIAVLLVIACLAILAPFTMSFNYQARVDWQSAVNVRDEVAAKQIQRGAIQLSLLLFEIQRLVFNQKQFRDFMGTMDVTQVAPYLMSIFGTPDGAEGLGAMAGVDGTVFQELALTEGTFEFRVYAESGKININCLASQKDDPANPAGRTVQTLDALMSPQIYNPLFEEEKSDGQYYTRNDIVTAIADYIDEDRMRFDIMQALSGGGSENYRYTELADPYLARNGRLDSLEELHLVQGIDDDWMAAFGHELTVYGECLVNLNFASPEQIGSVLRYAATEDDRWKTEGENFVLRVMPLANFMAQYREFNLFESLEQVKTIAGDPSSYMNMSRGFFGNNDDDDDVANLPVTPDGLNVWLLEKSPDTNHPHTGLQGVATVQPERIYTIEVLTTVGNVTKRLTAVYDMQYPRSQSSGKGVWLHVRED